MPKTSSHLNAEARMKARDIMTANPEFVTPDDTVSRAAEIMRDIDVGIVRVVEDRSSMRLQGVITARNIAVRHVAERNHEERPIRDLMTGAPLDKVGPEADVSEVMKLMKSDQVRRIAVVDEGDRLVGIIAQADLAVEAGPRDPEKVEEVLEETSKPAQPERRGV